MEKKCKLDEEFGGKGKEDKESRKEEGKGKRDCKKCERKGSSIDMLKQEQRNIGEV